MLLSPAVSGPGRRAGLPCGGPVPLVYCLISGAHALPHGKQEFGEETYEQRV